jgi:hypothetical protein
MLGVRLPRNIYSAKQTDADVRIKKRGGIGDGGGKIIMRGNKILAEERANNREYAARDSWSGCNRV